jgi:N-acetylneuraminic acid mutarotase
MLLFGGEGVRDQRGTFFDDLWTYAPASGAWHELTPVGPARPSKRGYHACAWDSTRARMWMFGGCAEGFHGSDDLWSFDLWSFDPQQRQWTRLAPPGPRPPGRWSAVLQYDPGTDALVLFSGMSAFDETCVPLRDLWVYRIRTNTWTQKTCTAPQLSQCASALDPQRGLLIIHGGTDAHFAVRSETWIYDVRRDTWRAPVAGTRFTKAHAGVWDTDDGRMMVFGGRGYGTVEDRVWSFDPDTEEWRVLGTADDPPGVRAFHSAVWDPKARALIVYGGVPALNSTPPGENRAWITHPPAW